MLQLFLILSTSAPRLASGADGGEANPGGFQCRPVDSEAASTPDFKTAVGVTCHALARKTGRAGSFLINVRPLGSSIILTVIREESSESRSIIMSDVEETPIAAQRIAEALIEGREVEQTQRLGRLLANETLKMREKRGRTKFAIGAVNLTIPAQGTGSGAGITLSLAYETPRVSLFGDLVWAGSSSGSGKSDLFTMGPGVRYYLSDRALSPYLSGGVGLVHVSVDKRYHAGYPEDGFMGSKTSFAPYCEAGMQFLRLHRSRLTVGVRVYLPFSKIDDTPGYFWDPIIQKSIEKGPGEAIYAVPVIVGATVSF